MGQSYRHLTVEDRIEIRVLRQEGRSQQYIADRLGRDRSTVKRELRRNRGQRGYRPRQAQAMAQARASVVRTRKMTPETIQHIEEKIAQDHSPEQISRTMEKTLGLRVSHETIYRHLWRDKAAGGRLYTHLRIASGRKRRKRYGKKDWRGRIPGRVGIEERPRIVEARRRFGDWEADLVSGVHHRGFLVTLVERKSRYTRIGHVVNKMAETVTAEIIRLLEAVRGPVHTITYDNGREFAAHATINATLDCSSYFAAPYHSWERGLNENTNGLIRQYFPKRSDLRKVTAEEIRFVEDRLNNRPRKALDFKTPREVLLRTG